MDSHEGGQMDRSPIADDHVDALTGLPGFALFRQEVNDLLRGIVPNADGGLHAIAFFNIENFKHYNQRYGYSAGDELISRLARSITDAFPDSARARFSVDQFVVLVRLDDLHDGVMAVRGAFRREHKDTTIWLRVGYYVLGTEDLDAGVACDHAKVACDELRGRRDSFMREYDDELRHKITWRRYVLEHFEEALEKGWIQAYCQPIIRVASGETCDVEVLARWHDPVEGLVSPLEFVSVLEDARLVHKLDLAILRDVCRTCHELEATGEPYIPFSINLSRLDFELCDIVTEVEAVLEEYGIPRERVAIEITESALTGNQEFLGAEVQRFRDAGFEVWMDDFGSGYSSLNVLKDYTFDLVKIDMVFLRGFENMANARVMLAKVIDMVKELGIKTLVEGVETTEQYEFLRALGCGRVQGFLFGRPRPMPASIEAVSNDAHPPVEPLGKHEFYEEIGRVNLMRPDPHPSVNGHYLPSDVAACIIRKRGERFEHLNVNDLYVKFRSEVGDDFSPEFADAVDRCIASNDWEHYLVSLDHHRYAVRVRCITQAKGFDAVGILAVVDEYYRAGA